MTFFFVFSIIILDITTLWGIKKSFPQFSSRHRRGIKNAFIIQSAVSLFIVLGGNLLQNYVSDYRMFALYYYIFGFMSAFYIPKSIYAVFLGINLAISRLFCKIPISKYGFWICLFFIFPVIWGILFGRYNFTVENVELTFENLPEAFDGYKIVHISDIHTGSFAGFAERFQKATDLINVQNPDIIVATGDMVNNFADETVSFIPVFSQMKARDGKYAVLGNHDYGGYYKWRNDADSVANHVALKNAIEEMGLELLNNGSIVISRDTSRIALAGVENWGVLKRHPKLGDIEKAIDTVRDIPFKILLSHDPAFWTEKVAGKTDIALTLSGHTHGMQIGLKLGKKRYNPLYLLRYRYLAGLYTKDGQFLYINRGLGVIGFPGRIGMSPEITVITLLSSGQSHSHILP